MSRITTVNKKLETVFKSIQTLPFKDIEKILFNIEILKNKYLYRFKQKTADLYENEMDMRKLIQDLEKIRDKG